MSQLIIERWGQVEIQKKNVFLRVDYNVFLLYIKKNNSTVGFWLKKKKQKEKKKRKKLGGNNETISIWQDMLESDLDFRFLYTHTEC